MKLETVGFLNSGAGKLKSTLLKIPLSFLGMAFGLVWLRKFLAIFPGVELCCGINAHMAFDAASGVALLFAAALSQRLTPLISHRRTLIAVAAVLSSASTMAAIAAETDIAWLLALSVILGGFGFSINSLAWIEFYTAFNPVRAVLYYCTARIAGEALAFAFEGYVAPYLFAMLALLPIFSVASLLKATASIDQEDKPNANPNIRPLPWKPALLLFSYALAYSMANLSLASLPQYPGKLLAALPAAIFILSIALSPKSFSLKSAYAAICIIMICALLIPLALPAFPSDVTAAAVGLSYSASKIISIFILGSLAYRMGASIIWLYGIAGGLASFALAIGDVLYRNVSSSIITIVLVALITLVAVLLAAERGVYSSWGVSIPKTQQNDPRQSAKENIIHAKELFHLTDREEEILHLLAQRKTVDSIASDMFIAKGTVKAHIQHIYQKMGIHSRQELYKLLDR